jgi:DNA replication protein DnaC
MTAQANAPWTCPRCEGSGFLLDENDEAIACSCRETRIRQARSSGLSSVIPDKYRNVSFDRFPVPELEQDNPTVVRTVRTFVRKCDENIAAGRGLWFMGDVGTGKTTLAMIVAKEALRRGHSVAIYSVPRLLSRIRASVYSEARDDPYLELFTKLATVDLLHLEDLGAQKQTDWVLEQLYSLINERYERQRSLVVTTNTSTEDLAEQIGQRTLSRLSEMTQQLPLFGRDHRIEYDPARLAFG